MTHLGYDKPLYLMAFDHRGSFEKGLFGATPPISAGVHAGIVDAKNLIYEAFVRAVEDGDRVTARECSSTRSTAPPWPRPRSTRGFALAMPVERSGQDEFDFEYGDDFGSHIEAFDPTFAKVLVRYNPEGDAATNARQTERLHRLSDWLHERDRRFLFELLVPPTDAQLVQSGGDHGRYDRDIRPRLLLEIVSAMQAAGVEPDVWKIEGLDERATVRASLTGPIGRSRQRRVRGARAWGRRAQGDRVAEGRCAGARVRRVRCRADAVADGPRRVPRRKADARNAAVRQIADRYLETAAAYAGAA